MSRSHQQYRLFRPKKLINRKELGYNPCFFTQNKANLLYQNLFIVNVLDDKSQVFSHFIALLLTISKQNIFMIKLFPILFFLYSFSVFAQKKYDLLTIELIKQIENNHFTKQIPTAKILEQLNELPDSAKITYFRKKAKLFFTEIAYGHKPIYLQYQSLKEVIDNEAIEQAVLNIEKGKTFAKVIEEIEPKNEIFRKLKPFSLIDSLPQLNENLNFCRYLNRFELNKYIVLNIPSAHLIFYQNHKNILDMKVIVGRPQNETPRLAGYIESIVIYPYWVPTYSIATKELLPLIKQNIKYLDNNGFDVLNQKGQLVDPKSVNWHSLSIKYFPYKLRQSTGCDNSLGLLKFNLVNPFSVYLHDTKHQKGAQSLFEKENRFFSHGCMRLSRPMELANLVLDEPMFTDDFMETCLKEAKMRLVPLKTKIPVFVIYQTQQIDEEGVFHQFKNPYKLRVEK